LDSGQLAEVELALKRGPEAFGYASGLWTARRVRDLIEYQSGVRYHEDHVWRILRKLGWSCQRPTGRALERNEEGIRHWKKYRWPQIKKSAARAAHHYLHRRKRTERATAPSADLGAARTEPVLQYHFNWKVMSAAAGITWWNFYFRLYPATIKAPQVVDFLGHLLRHLKGKLLVIWDGLPAHRAQLVSEFIRAQKDRLVIDWLPGYAPELNPVEYIWGYRKHHELPNFCPRDFASSAARPAAHCAACAGANRWCDRSGAKQNCHYDMQSSIR
jgi:transposase